MRKLTAASLLVPMLALAQAPPPGGAPPPGSRVAPAPLRAGVPVPALQRGANLPTGAQPPAGPAAPGARPGAPAPSPAAPSSQGSAQTLPPGGAAGSAKAQGECVPMHGRFLLAFNKADIVDVLEQASRWTCRNFAYTEDTARGKITLLSKTPVTAEEAYAAFLASLTSNGIAIYQTGKYWKLVRIADSKKAPIPTILDEGAEAPALEQPVTKLIRLKHADPDQLRTVMGNFISPQGADLQTIPPDVLIITDIALNVRRVERLVEALDRPGSSDLIRIIQVQYAAARDLADKVNQIFAAGPAAPGRPVSKRPLIGGVAPPAVAGAPPVPAAPAGEPSEVALTKVLADERTNKLIVVADEKSFQRILDLVKQLDTPTAGEGTIHVVFLKNANAEDLAQTLQALAQGQASARRATGAAAPPVAPGQAAARPVAPPGATSAELFSGEVKITADKPSNALVVLASGSDFATVLRLIEKLDRPRRQVFVEAVIMEVNVSNDNKFGVAMHTAIPVNTRGGTGYIPLGFEPSRFSSLNPTSLISLGGFLTGLVGPTTAELTSFGLPIPSVGLVIQALQASSDVNVLSTPHILAQDNEESEIVVGQNVPFQAGYNPGFQTNLGTGTTASTAGFGSLALASFVAPIQRQNVDLKLKIKPQINEGEMVRLDIDEQAEEIASNDPQLGPTTSKRSLKTKIVAKDQTTVVIGGLIQDRTLTSVQKVPVLGDIPLLGWLFRDTVTSKKKTNLLLFLTPYIIRDQSDYRRILERKQAEQREFIEEYYGKQSDLALVTRGAADYGNRGGPFSRLRKEVQAESLKLENGGPGAPGERAVVPPRGSSAPPIPSDRPRPAPLQSPEPPVLAPPPAPEPAARPPAPAGQPAQPEGTAPAPAGQPAPPEGTAPAPPQER